MAGYLQPLSPQPGPTHKDERGHSPHDPTKQNNAVAHGTRPDHSRRLPAEFRVLTLRPSYINHIIDTTWIQYRGDGIDSERYRVRYERLARQYITREAEAPAAALSQIEWDKRDPHGGIHGIFDLPRHPQGWQLAAVRAAEAYALQCHAHTVSRVGFPPRTSAMARKAKEKLLLTPERCRCPQ